MKEIMISFGCCRHVMQQVCYCVCQIGSRLLRAHHAPLLLHGYPLATGCARLAVAKDYWGALRAKVGWIRALASCKERYVLCGFLGHLRHTRAHMDQFLERGPLPHCFLGGAGGEGADVLRSADAVRHSSFEPSPSDCWLRLRELSHADAMHRSNSRVKTPRSRNTFAQIAQTRPFWTPRRLRGLLVVRVARPRAEAVVEAALPRVLVEWPGWQHALEGSCMRWHFEHSVVAQTAGTMGHWQGLAQRRIEEGSECPGSAAVTKSRE